MILAIAFPTWLQVGSTAAAAGRNIKQVQKWLGHADPAFTLRTYVHLIDEGVGDDDFFDRTLDFEEDQEEVVPLAA